MTEIYNSDYFKERGLEQKHFVQTLIWTHLFSPTKVLDVGCGLGHYIYAFKTFCNIEAHGCDLDSVVPLCPYKELEGSIKGCDVKQLCYKDNEFDFVMCYDTLEHIDEKDLDIALKELSRVCSKTVLLSVPTKGDPNLYLDDTHKIFRNMEWWKYKVSKYFNIQPTIPSIPFAKQIILGVKK